mgnify:CR=1 FL=1|tara:strand:- start:1475 stop:2668 length:1194 start_codon:yes stop_codon:yes gene_type:complete
MIRFILILLLVLIAAWIGIEIKNTESYVSIFYQDYTVSLKLITAIIITIICFIVLHIVINLLNAIFRFPKKYSIYRRERKLKKAYSSLLNAITELLQGHPKISEKLFLKASSHKKNSSICYLLAAKAAHYLNARERINDYCKMAYTANPQLELAINLTQAKLFFDNEQYELVLANLTHIKSIDPKNIAALKLSFKTYKKLNDWLKILNIIPDLNRENLYPDEFIQQLKNECYKNHLIELNKNHSIESLYNFWEQVPKKYKLDNECLVILINSYNKQKNTNIEIQSSLESYTKQALNHHWSDELLIAYINLPSENNARKIKLISNWQKNQPYNINILNCLAKIHINLKEYEPAKKYLLESYNINSTYGDINLLLGFVFDQLQDSDTAIKYYTKHYKLQ